MWDKLMSPFQHNDKAKLKAIYDYIVSHYNPKYNYQSEIKNITTDVDNRCPLPMQYIKQRYVMDNTEKIKYTENRKDVYDEYTKYMKRSDKIQVSSSTNFYKILGEYGITARKSNGKYLYDLDYDLLLNMFKKFNIINDDELSSIETIDDITKDETEDSITFAIGKLEEKIKLLKAKLIKH